MIIINLTQVATPSDFTRDTLISLVVDNVDYFKDASSEDASAVQVVFTSNAYLYVRETLGIIKERIDQAKMENAMLGRLVK